MSSRQLLTFDLSLDYIRSVPSEPIPVPFYSRVITKALFFHSHFPDSFVWESFLPQLARINPPAEEITDTHRVLLESQPAQRGLRDNLQRDIGHGPLNFYMANMEMC